MICYTHITYMKVCMGWISYFSVQAVQKLDGIPQIHCGVWEKKWKRKEIFFWTVGDFFFLKKDFECYDYKKKGWNIYRKDLGALLVQLVFYSKIVLFHKYKVFAFLQFIVN